MASSLISIKSSSPSSSIILPKGDTYLMSVPAAEGTTVSSPHVVRLVRDVLLVPLVKLEGAIPPSLELDATGDNVVDDAPDVGPRTCEYIGQHYAWRCREKLKQSASKLPPASLLAPKGVYMMASL